tara:strand:- start:262 stop:528 length:267 start_codon:yes stop_codon:yes gene_type:complete
MTKIKQTKPKWFKGVVYKKGTTVQNRFGGESCELNALELSIYDFIIGASNVIEMQEPFQLDEQVVKDLRKGLAWFRKNNINAYMILLD